MQLPYLPYGDKNRRKYVSLIHVLDFDCIFDIIGSYPMSAETDTYLQEPLPPVTPEFPPVITSTVVSSHADHSFTMSKQESLSLTNNPDSKPNNCK